MVQLSKREEDLVTEPGQDPAFDDLNANFRLRLVSGFSGAGRYHRNLIMLSQLLIGGIQFGIVTTGFANPAFQVIRNQDFGDSTEELQHPDVAEKPV